MTLTNKSPRDGQVRRRTYVTCLKCGEELAYNWQEMKVEWPISPTPLRPQALVSIARGRRSRYRRLFTADKPVPNSVNAERQGWVVLEPRKSQPVTHLLAK
jgi:hypothetical protein